MGPMITFLGFFKDLVDDRFPTSVYVACNDKSVPRIL
jgi:hypothetical protein